VLYDTVIRVNCLIIQIKQKVSHFSGRCFGHLLLVLFMISGRYCLVESYLLMMGYIFDAEALSFIKKVNGL